MALAPKWKVLTSVVFGVFMVILDSTVVNVAFPTIRTSFGTGLGATQWVISVYVLALGVATPLSGFLGDRFGMRRVYVAGIGAFAVGSLLCGLAPSLPLLVVARVVQGLGGGAALPLGTAFLFRAFPPEEQGRALGVFGVALLVAPALGPLLGGLLVGIGHWRWIFFLNVPVGALGVALGSRWLTEYPLPPRPRLNWASAVFSTLGFGAVLYGTSVAATAGWAAARTLLWLGGGAAALAAFAVAELRSQRDPLLDLRLLGDPVFLNANLVGWVATLALFGAEFLLPVYLQTLRGLSPQGTGLVLLPLAVAAGVVTPIAGRLYDRVGPRPLVAVGYAVLVVNTWELARLGATTPISTIVFLLVLRGIALGLTVQTTLTLALAVVPVDQLSRASALVRATRSTVQAIGVAVLTAVLASTLSPEAQRAEADGAGVCAATAITAHATTSSPPDAIAHALVPRTADPCVEALAGFGRAYTVTFWAALVALGLSVLLPGWPAAWLGRAGRARTGPTNGPVRPDSSRAP